MPKKCITNTRSPRLYRFEGLPRASIRF